MPCVNCGIVCYSLIEVDEDNEYCCICYKDEIADIPEEDFCDDCKERWKYDLCPCCHEYHIGAEKNDG